MSMLSKGKRVEQFLKVVNKSAAAEHVIKQARTCY